MHAIVRVVARNAGAIREVLRAKHGSDSGIRAEIAFLAAVVRAVSCDRAREAGALAIAVLRRAGGTRLAARRAREL